MINILHVYKTFLNDTFGGVEQVIAQIAMTPNTSDYCHTVVSLSKNPGTDTKNCFGIKNIRYRESLNIASNTMSFDLLRDFSRIVEPYDVIHYHFPWPFADLLHGFSRIKKPSVLTYHSDIVRQKKLLFFYRPLMHRFLHAMDYIVATSPNYFATSEVLSQYKSKVRVIPIGLNKENYPIVPLDRDAYWRQRFGDRFFLFVGVLRYYKGLHILLDALKNTNFPVVLVGTGPIEAELKARATALNLNHVHFVGQVSEVDKVALLRLCTSVVFPSHLRSEAFGVSLLEGAMFGKALISAEIGTGTSYINVHEKTGLVVPPDDPIALSQAMFFIWENPDRAKLMGQAAAARYWNLFTGHQMITEYEKIYINATSMVDKI